MRQNYEMFIEIPQGINCIYSNGTFECSKGNTKLLRNFETHNVDVEVKDGKINLRCEKANRKKIANINSYVAHIKNLFKGLSERFVYEMEICNVHFPMTVKVDKDKLLISNFLGEKVARNAKIISGVEVKVENNKIIISSADVEKAGQTAANIEKATTVTKKDRRIFQDGIFITKKPGAEI